MLRLFQWARAWANRMSYSAPRTARKRARGVPVCLTPGTLTACGGQVDVRTSGRPAPYRFPVVLLPGEDSQSWSEGEISLGTGIVVCGGYAASINGTGGTERTPNERRRRGHHAEMGLRRAPGGFS